MEIESICVHGARDAYNLSGAVSVPIYQSATFVHPGMGQSTGFDYSRVQNPTRASLEQAVARLEEGSDALAFSSGMAAIAALMELFAPGDHIIASDDLYGGTIRLFDNISRKNGLVFDYANTGDLHAVAARLTPRTKAVFVETPTNPLLRVTDIAALSAELAGRDILLIVDNTFLTPYFMRPLALGADIVMHSGTKYLGGHNDTLAGFLITSRSDIAEKLRMIYKTVGSCLSPFDSFLLIRGLKTLALRMEKSQENAMRLAGWLTTHPKVKIVYYPGLPSHPDYAVTRKQASGFGAMISFEVDGEDTARELLSKTKIILYAESLGGVESLITYPVLQTHADIPAPVREARGINQRLLRISVGIENIKDLLDDLKQALA
ncbi:MAG: PLP-dependent aspartate aminotransferase family protein [Desulfarculales bacterium]|jgi:cystathionine beta-lyase/cystathionine gamma-synthase|nr:PLP-dependent aspartate aminotransferase family protein [Desulfarculales bacterium]